jgi:hypothetical protein
MPEHINSVDCWCHPIEYFDFDGASVFVHQEPDGTVPPASVLAGAITSLMNDDPEDHVYDVTGQEIKDA